MSIREQMLQRVAFAPEKFSLEQLKNGVQDGTIPAYIGIPAIQERMKLQQQVQGAMSGQTQQQMPIAQQIMQQAAQATQPAPQPQPVPQGVPSLPSNLPAKGMAGGGIIAFGDGGYADDPEDDRDDLDIENERLAAASDYNRQKFLQEMYDTPETPELLMSSEGVSLGDVSSGKGLSEGIKPLAASAAPVAASPQTTAVQRAPSAISAESALEKYALGKESGGRRYDKNGRLLESPKGALGEMQVMPKTITDPGFGVTPARDDSPDEIARVGRDYLRTMEQRYGDPKLALMAYNWGPGNVDRWLKAGADPRKVPEETRKYVADWTGAEGGITSLASGGVIAFSGKDGSLVPSMSDAEREWRLRTGNIMGPYPGADAVSSGKGFFSSLNDYTKDFADRTTEGVRGVIDKYGRRVREAAQEGNYSGAVGQAIRGTGAGIVGLGQDALTTVGAVNAPLINVARTAATGESSPTKKPAAAPSGIDYSQFKPDARDVNIEKQPAQEEGITFDYEEPTPLPEQKPSKLQEYLEQMQGDLAERKARAAENREQAKWEALTQAGLATMAGGSPYALQNIGAGGMKGIESLGASQKQNLLEERYLQQGQMGVLKGLFDQEQHIEALKQRAVAHNDIAELKRLQAEQNALARQAGILQKYGTEYDTILKAKEVEAEKVRGPYMMMLQPLRMKLIDNPDDKELQSKVAKYEAAMNRDVMVATKGFDERLAQLQIQANPNFAGYKITGVK